MMMTKMLEESVTPNLWENTQNISHALTLQVGQLLSGFPFDMNNARHDIPVEMGISRGDQNSGDINVMLMLSVFRRWIMGSSMSRFQEIGRTAE